MANEKNLKPVRSTEEARARGKKGGVASGKARQHKKTLKEAAVVIMEMISKNPELGAVENGYEAVAAALIRKALCGDVAAINSLRDLLGEKPTDKVQVDANVEVIFQIPRPGRSGNASTNKLPTE